MTLLCLACTWLLLITLPWCLWVSLREGISRLKQMHSIPCSHCAFFTGDYRLKCAVHPIKALTDEAIHCLDYAPALSPRVTILPAHKLPAHRLPAHKLPAQSGDAADISNIPDFTPRT